MCKYIKKEISFHFISFILFHFITFHSKWADINHFQGLYFPPVYVALMPADISSSTIVSVLVFFLGRVSDGSGEGLLKLLREFAFET